MTDKSDGINDPFEAALAAAEAAGEAAAAGTGDAAAVLVSSELVTIRKPDRAEFFYSLWYQDLQLLQAKDERGADVYAMLDPESSDIARIKQSVLHHLKVVRLVYCLGVDGARFLMPAVHSDTSWFRSFREFTETIAPTHVGPFKRISVMESSHYKFFEALETKPFDGGPEHLDQGAILKSALPLVSSMDDPLVKRLLGIGL